MGLLNQNFTLEIVFHDVIHGFRIRCGAGTASLEAKLLQHLTSMREVVIHDIFMDLLKVYDDLDREKYLNILVGYNVGPREICLFHTYRGRLTVVVKARGYYPHCFKGYLSLTQRDALYPTIFNVAVGAVIWH